ncbi:MAG: molybdenum cofactor guanylyltransferase [Bacteroidia bacterium]|nr:molybdenum cofactor guanylyltransferase [Bacteroidia bacterium]
MEKDLKLLFLLGGKSSRMGFDKFLLEIGGKPQWVNLSDLAKELEIDHYFSLDSQQQLPLHNVIRDLIPDLGPIGGIYSFFNSFPDSSALILPTDMPGISLQAIRNLIENRNKNLDGTFYWDKGRNQVAAFPGIWEKSSVMALEKAIDTGKLSLIKTLNKLKLKIIEAYDQEIFNNLNTPEDYELFIKKNKGEEA